MPQHHLQHGAEQHSSSQQPTWHLEKTPPYPFITTGCNPPPLRCFWQIAALCSVLSMCCQIASYVSPSPGLPNKTLQTPNPGSVRGTAVPKRQVLSWDSCSKEPAWVQEQNHPCRWSFSDCSSRADRFYVIYSALMFFLVLLLKSFIHKCDSQGVMLNADMTSANVEIYLKFLFWFRKLFEFAFTFSAWERYPEPICLKPGL